VPDEHIVPFARLAPRAREDVAEYVAELATGSRYWDAVQA